MIWYSALAVGYLALGVLFLFTFNFTDTTVQLLFGVAGTMLAIIAAVAIFVHQAVGERGDYWATRVVQLIGELAESSGPDKVHEEMKSPTGAITVGNLLLTDLVRVSSAISSAAILLGLSLLTGSLAVFGPEFKYDWKFREITREIFLARWN